jgi:CheY-like chemotaxis protein
MVLDFTSLAGNLLVLYRMDKKLFNRILILDDDPASQYLARLTMEETGLAEEIDTFPTAKEGLDFVRAHCLDEHAAHEDCPDLILLDINMPAMDGFDFLDALEMLGKNHLIRKVVVVLTSSDFPRDKEKMQAYGVRSFIVKPLTEEKVMKLVAMGG